ncbi:MAG TPA: hypothetical protein VFA70_07745 [Dehalococcoidia bacterium]|nr:hypothetical protein [Dehalococcoidia bacterium]
MSNHARRLLVLFPLVALPLVVACSSGSKSSNSSSSSTSSNSSISVSSNSRNISIQSNQSNQRQSSSSGNLSDCDYATRVETAFYPILGGVFDLLGLALSATPGPSGANVAETAAEKQVLDALSTSASQSITALQAISPPADFQAFHADLTSEVQSFADQLKSAQQALSAGDQAKADQILQGLTASPFEDLNTKYPQQTQRLDACPTPAP